MILTKLRAYQQQAVDKALQHDGFALLMDMRTGKTLTALAIVHARQVKRVMVVCPKRAVGVWQSEIEKHFRDPSVAFRIVNYEFCNSSIRDRHRAALQRAAKKRELLRFKPDMVILDEMHRIKNRTSLQARLCHALGRIARYRLGLTGTAIAQGPQDAWSQFKFIEPGLFNERWADFQAEYLVLGGYLGKQIVGYRNQARFNALLHSRSYRVTMNEVTPVVTRLKHVQVPVELTTSRRYYNQLQGELLAEIQGQQLQAPIVVAKLQKLQQMTGGAVLDQEGKNVLLVGDEKLSVLSTLVRRHNKAVVFARYLHELDRIEASLNELGITTQQVRGNKDYSGSFNTDVVIVQIQSGLAIDLSEADAAVFFSCDFSYINFQQAKARILAHGKPKATYYYLIAKDTVDLTIYRALKKKTNVATEICDTYRKTALLS